MLQKAIGFLFLFVLAPSCMGLLWAVGIKRQRRRPAHLYLAGFFTELAVFQLLAVPVMLREPRGMKTIVADMNLLLLLLSVSGPVLFFFQKRKERAAGAASAKHGGLRAVLTGFPGECMLYWLLAFAMIGFQMYQSYVCASFDGDDAYYVVQSVLADQTGVLNRIRPYTGLSTDLDIRHALATLPLWVAYVARLTGIHATIVAHTLLPLVLIPLTYLCYFEIGRKLLGTKNSKLPIFMTLVSIMQIWGNASIYTNATFFLTRTWQGKSVMANLVLLAQIWVLLEIFEGRETGKERESANAEAGPKEGAFLLLLAVTNVAAAMMTSMGAFLSAMLIGVVGLTAAIRLKKGAILLKLAACCVPNVVYLLLLVLL